MAEVTLVTEDTYFLLQDKVSRVIGYCCCNEQEGKDSFSVFCDCLEV